MHGKVSISYAFLPIVTKVVEEQSPRPTRKGEDVATEIRDLQREVKKGHYDVPAREVAEAVMFWHFGRPTDLLWAYGIPTQHQKEDEARRTD
jgi:hypothetical protein